METNYDNLDYGQAREMFSGEIQDEIDDATSPLLKRIDELEASLYELQMELLNLEQDKREERV
jgi:hypothetical protein